MELKAITCRGKERQRQRYRKRQRERQRAKHRETMSSKTEK